MARPYVLPEFPLLASKYGPLRLHGPGTHYARQDRAGHGREILWSTHDAALDDAVLEDFILTGVRTPDGDHKNHVKWPIRIYAVRRAVLRRFRIRRARKEHGAYINVDGDLEIHDFSIEDCGSQALQIIYRPSESVRPQLAQERRTIYVHDGLAIRCGNPYGARPAFAVTLFDCGQDDHGIVENVHAFSGFAPTLISGKLVRSYGAFLFSNMRTATLLGCSAHYDQPEDRPTVQFEQCNLASMIGTHVPAGRVDFIDCDDIHLDRCTGGAQVYIDRKLVGTLRDVSYMTTSMREDPPDVERDPPRPTTAAAAEART